MKTPGKWSRMVFVILLPLLFAGCSKNSTGSDEYVYASVRFIHLAPSTELIDWTYLVYDSEQYADLVTEVPYGEQNGYYAFVSGSRSFRAYLSGTSLSVANNTFSLADNGKYTVIANDLDAAIDPELLAFPDTTEVSASGKALLRFIHVSADAPDMDIIKTDQTRLVTDLEQHQASGYIELDPGTYQFTAVSSGTDYALLTLEPITLTSGVNYTVIFSGTVYGLPGVVLNGKIYQETGVQ